MERKDEKDEYEKNMDDMLKKLNDELEKMFGAAPQGGFSFRSSKTINPDGSEEGFSEVFDFSKLFGNEDYTNEKPMLPAPKYEREYMFEVRKTRDGYAAIVEVPSHFKKDDLKVEYQKPGILVAAKGFEKKYDMGEYAKDAENMEIESYKNGILSLKFSRKEVD